MPTVTVWTVLFDQVEDEGRGVDVHGSHQRALDSVRETFETSLGSQHYDAKTAQAMRAALDGDDLQRALDLHNAWTDEDRITIERHAVKARTVRP